MIGSSYRGLHGAHGAGEPASGAQGCGAHEPDGGWLKGDDWFHNGAFRQTNFDYIYGQNHGPRGRQGDRARRCTNDFQLFLASGSAGDFAHRFGIDTLPFFNKVAGTPAYDQFWSAQALDQILAAQPLKTATMYVTSIWDQEDMYGGSTPMKRPSRRIQDMI